MIFSILEKVSEREKVQKVMVRGKKEEIALELENIMTEMLKHDFPEDMIMEITYNALRNTDHLA